MINDLDIRLQEDVAEVMDFLKYELSQKLEDQGHGSRSTSNLIQSIEHEISNVAGVIIGSMFMNHYYIFLERGVKPGNIPYSGNTGRGGTSLYIQALIKFWRLKGKNPTEAKRAAFATANVHRVEGMPTRNSYKKSKDGTRKGFLSSTLEKNEDIVFGIFRRRAGNTVEVAFSEMVNSFVQKF